MKTDPAIIGGIVARVGDQLIDGSVVNQLRRLRARLAASLAVVLSRFESRSRRTASAS